MREASPAIPDAPGWALTPDELAATLAREFEAAESYAQRIETLTAQAFRYYEAQPFGNEIEGRSAVVLPDVQETIDYMQQSVLRTFVSGERTVEFETTQAEGKTAAAEATAAINQVFMRQQDGFRILHDGLYDGLLRKIGVFKTGVETVERVSRQRLRGGLDAVVIQAATQGFSVESIDAFDPASGIASATLKREAREKRFVDYAVPLGEFRFSPGARHEDEADYLCHAAPKTRSQLVEMGFDADQVAALPALERDAISESLELDGTPGDPARAALELVLFCEEYARIDLDGDGIAERVRVCRVGDTILIDGISGEWAVETVDDQPFAVFCPFPRPHRLVGYSLADKVMHIQLQRSFVARQLFDGLAYANMPRLVIDSAAADETTINDILTPIPGSPIRARGGAAAVQPLHTGFDPGKSLAVMQWITGERESLTGITRLNQGLDADALNTTATGTALMQAQGQQNEEAIARQFAETIARLFLKKYRLMRAEGEPIAVSVDGEPRLIDPATWPEDVAVTVKVGLGSNSRDTRIRHRMALGGALSQAVANGMAGPEHVFAWFDGMARDTGLGQGGDFCFDPARVDREPAQDPELVAAHGKLQLERDKAAAEAGIALYRIDREAEVRRYAAAQGGGGDSPIGAARAGGRLDA